jgi:hypothetical protein
MKQKSKKILWVVGWIGLFFFLSIALHEGTHGLIAVLEPGCELKEIHWFEPQYMVINFDRADIAPHPTHVMGYCVMSGTCSLAKDEGIPTIVTCIMLGILFFGLMSKLQKWKVI